MRKLIVSAISDFSMIEEGDKVMVACSGGKDSTILLLMLEEIRKRSPYKFSIHPVILDQKQPGFKVEDFQAFLKEQGLELTILDEDTYSIVKEKVEEGKAYCGLCSRLRRGILYNYAHDQGFTKIALGHHRDDLNETLLMNLFFSGKMATMPPKLKARDSRNIIIRPLAYVREKDLISIQEDIDFPVIPCNLCGSQENLQRQQIKNLLAKLEGEIPHISSSMLNAQKNVIASLLLDNSLWDFEDIQAVDTDPAKF